MEDYDKSFLPRKDRIKAVIEGFVLIAIIGVLFYNHLIFIVILSPFSFLYMKRKQKQYREKRKYELNLMFRETLMGITNALNAGYSIENSFIEARKDLLLLDSADSDMAEELLHVERQLRQNERLEDLVMDLARRSHVEDIENFTEVFVTAKRSGGNLLQIIRRTADNISDKIEIQREIVSILAGKKMEARIMMIVPVGIIAYMRIFSPGFLDCLYGNYTGIGMMTAALFVYGAGFLLAEKIVAIEV